MTNLVIAYPLRGWLNYMLKQLMLTVAMPAFNAQIKDQMAVDTGAATQAGFTQPLLSESTVTLGELHSLNELTLSVVPGPNKPAYGAPTGTAYRNLTTRFLWKIPKAGLNRPEDFALVQGVLDDLFTNLFLDIDRYILTPLDPATDMPALPAGASFQQCVLGDIVPLPMPVKTADSVTRVEGGYCDFTCFFEIVLDRPGRMS